MSAVDRVRRVSGNRLTERQARFLVTVMQHSGVCVPRQFPAFAGIKHGQRTVDLFERLVRWGFAVAYPCRHHRGRVYHVRYKPLYRAIDDADTLQRRVDQRLAENRCLAQGALEDIQRSRHEMRIMRGGDERCLIG